MAATKHQVEPRVRNSQASRGQGSDSRWPDFASYLPHLVVAAAYIVLAARLFRIVQRYAVNILTWDQWDFDDATLFQQHSWWQAFRWQHGPHRQGLGAVLQKLLEPVIRWNTRSEAFGIWAIIVLAALAALYLKRRLFGGIDFSDLIIPLLFLTPAIYATLLSSANPAHGSLPLLLMVLYCLAWSLRSSAGKYGLVLLLNFVMTYTGFGMFIGFLTPLLIAADIFRSRRQGLAPPGVAGGVALLVSLASLASFFVGYKMSPAASCFSLWPKNPLQYGHFTSLMMADFIGFKGTGPFPTLAGAVLTLALISCLAVTVKAMVSSPTPGDRTAAVSALLGYSLLFCANAAYGRLCLGLAEAQSSRYMIYLVPGFFAIYLYALSPRKRMARWSILSGLLLVALLSSARVNSQDRWLMQNGSRYKRAWKECYLVRHDIQQCDALTNFKIYPFPPQMTRLREKLDFLERNHLNLYAR